MLICTVQQSFECYKIDTLVQLPDVYRDTLRLTGLHKVANGSRSASPLLKNFAFIQKTSQFHPQRHGDTSVTD